MRENQTILALTTFLFIAVLSVIIAVKGPHLGVINKNIYFDKARLPKYVKFLITVGILSVLVGFMVGREIAVTLQYVGLNIFVAAIMGANIILYRYREKTNND